MDLLTTGKARFHYGPGGALVSDKEIAGITQMLDDSSAVYYGGHFMVGESMTESCARRIADLLGGEFEDF